MRGLLRPARIQLSTICRGFGSSIDFLLRAVFLTGTPSLMLTPGIGSFRRIHVPPFRMASLFCLLLIGSPDIKIVSGSTGRIILQKARINLFCFVVLLVVGIRKKQEPNDRYANIR
jgi:hypothetical protein